MLCPVAEVLADCIANVGQEHRDAADRVLEKLYHHLPPVEIGHVKDTFWNECRLFHSKDGDIYGKGYIWIGSTATQGVSHVWHNQYSAGTEVLGRVACVVTSKILGIGNAERQWGAVKKLKMCRPNLQSDKLKKHSTLFAAACIRRSRMKLKVCVRRCLFCALFLVTNTCLLPTENE